MCEEALWNYVNILFLINYLYISYLYQNGFIFSYFIQWAIIYYYHLTCGYLLTPLALTSYTRKAPSHCMNSFFPIVLQNPTLVHCGVPSPTILDTATYFALLRLMALGQNCLRKEGKEEKVLVLFCNAHIVTLHVILCISSLLFYGNSIYSWY